MERNDNMKSSSPLLPTPDLVEVENLPPGSVRVIENKGLDFRGPVVGHYSVAVDNDLYDLNDHYSKPRFLGNKTIIRSPAEAAINLFALVCLITLSAYAYFQNPESLDYWTLPFKIIHFVFHTIVHIVPNWSSKDGMEHRKCLRIVCGILFGISRYIVLLIYLYRMGTWVFVFVLLVFLLTIKLKFLGGRLNIKKNIFGDLITLSRLEIVFLTYSGTFFEMLKKLKKSTFSIKINKKFLIFKIWQQ